MAHVHLAHFEMEIKRHLMCVCGDRLKRENTHILARIHTFYPFSLSLTFIISFARSSFGHASFGVCCRPTLTHSTENGQISHKTHGIIFSGTQTIHKAAIYRLKEKIVEEWKKNACILCMAINNGTKWIFMCCLLFKYTFSVLSDVASRCLVRLWKSNVFTAQCGRVREVRMQRKKTSVIIFYAYRRNNFKLTQHSHKSF